MISFDFLSYLTTLFKNYAQRISLNDAILKSGKITFKKTESYYPSGPLVTHFQFLYISQQR